MFARRWVCHCGHENYGSFSQGQCDSCRPLRRYNRHAERPGGDTFDLDLGLEPEVEPSPYDGEYEKLQSMLARFHAQRKDLELKIAVTSAAINMLKRQEAERIGHRPRTV